MSARLSILIPSIPSRFDMARTLYLELMMMIGEKDIEVLMLVDNKKRTIGMKREALKNAALSSTVGSEAWNSRDLKSRPH